MRTEPVVLVHGWGGSFARTWQEPGWEALLADAGRQVIGVDLLGHGRSPKPHDAQSYADLTPAIVDALPADGSPVDAIGFSLGAMTLLAVACAHPERFSRLIVSGIGANVFREDRTPELADAVEGHGDTENVVAQLFAQYANQPGNDPVALAACLRRERPRLTPELLRAVKCPVLVVLGDKDFAGPADPLVEALPDARLVTLANTDHFATPNSFKFIDAALDFLDAVPG